MADRTSHLSGAYVVCLIALKYALLCSSLFNLLSFVFSIFNATLRPFLLEISSIWPCERTNERTGRAYLRIPGFLRLISPLDRNFVTVVCVRKFRDSVPVRDWIGVQQFVFKK